MIALTLWAALAALAGAALTLWAARRPALSGALAARLGPFLDLLDARYLPLLFVNAPQAYTVYAWLLREGTPEPIAMLGGLGFEFVAVGAIAWAVRGAGWAQARMTAVTALAFSVAVAVVYYHPTSGTLAFLHAGYPLVAFAYVLMMHAPNQTDRGPGRWARLWSALARRRTAPDPAPDQADRVAVVQPPDHQLPAPEAGPEGAILVQGAAVPVRALARALEAAGHPVPRSTLIRAARRAAGEEAGHGREE